MKKLTTKSSLRHGDSRLQQIKIAQTRGTAIARKLIAMNLQNLSKIQEGNLGHIGHSASFLRALEYFSFTLPSADINAFCRLALWWDQDKTFHP